MSDASAERRRLLAVDLGFRTGLAYFVAGRLVQYRSQNYGNRQRLKRGAERELRAPYDLVVVEGGPDLARAWLAAAERRGARTLRVEATDWRKDVLSAKEQRSGAEAKDAAIRLARAMIDRDGAPKKASLRHDAAEAILLGAWACEQRGWRDAP